MRIVYLCKVNPPPPNSDYVHVREFFDELPKHLHPRDNRKNASKHVLLFADNVSNKWIPSLHDCAVVFVTPRFLEDEVAMECFEYARQTFPDLICIDLYNNLSTEQKGALKKKTPHLFTREEGKRFLLNSFFDEDSLTEQEVEKLEKSIETDGYGYLDEKISALNSLSEKNERMALLCYYGAILPLLGMIIFLLLSKMTFPKEMSEGDVYTFVYKCIKTVVFSGVMVALTRYLFMLGKSFMVEAIRISNRAHAIGLGKLYLQLYKSRFEWTELKEVLQNWNIDSGSAFKDLDAKDIENVSVEKIVSALKNVK